MDDHRMSKDTQNIIDIRRTIDKKEWKLNYDLSKAPPIKNEDKSTFSSLFLNVSSERTSSTDQCTAGIPFNN